MNLQTILLRVDDDDARTIHEHIAKWQLNDAVHKIGLPEGESDMAGGILAEELRSLEEYRSLYDVEHPK